MFRSRTLFVIGAGASVEAGLPTSASLKTTIARNIDIQFDNWEQLSGDREITNALRHHVARMGPRRDINPYLHAARAIRDAMPQALSIDDYIDTHRDDEKMHICGKLGIVRSILEAEKRSTLFFDEHRENLNFGGLSNTWYHGLMQLVSEGVPRSEVGRIFSNTSFIVFNYDRCVEHFLVNALENYYRLAKEDAQGIVRDLTILHPYGVVGYLPWYADGQKGVPFGGSEAGGTDLLELAGQIKTFTEQTEDPSALEAIRREVEDTEVVVFLGFAFHRQNMNLLSCSGRASNAKRVFATAFGISRSDCEVVKAQIQELLGGKPRQFRINLRNDLTCAALFSEFWRSLTV